MQPSTLAPHFHSKQGRTDGEGELAMALGMQSRGASKE